MADQIILSREEVREAREEMGYGPCPEFMSFAVDSLCVYAVNAYCRLCKRLTEFVEGAGDEEIEKDIEEAIKEVREARALLAAMREEMIEEYTDYAKQEIRFCPYCGATLGIV